MLDEKYGDFLKDVEEDDKMPSYDLTLAYKLDQLPQKQKAPEGADDQTKSDIKAKNDEVK